ncbi:unknown [Bacteroides sp. CAG:530]|nr:unknown [Bacteroides sp. CAG:530]
MKKQCEWPSEPLRWFDLSIAMFFWVIYGKFMLIAT